MEESSGSRQSFKDWVISIYKERKPEPRQPAKPKIQRVPQLLRENESYKDCYDPIVVSIGPYHHGKGNLSRMEKLKSKFVIELFFKHGIVDHPFDEFVEKTRDARAYYAEGSTDHFSDEEFTRMIFLDGCFILYFINCFCHGKISEMNMNPQNIAHVRRDLFLLENQLPFIVLQVLIKLSYRNVQDHKRLIESFVKCQIDFPQGEFSEADKPLHLLDLLWIELVVQDPPLTANDQLMALELCDYTFRSVNELKTVGINCKKSKTVSLKDVHFHSYRLFGYLSLPPIAIDEFTKVKYLNLIAYEACPDAFTNYPVISYICLMDSLIGQTEDVKELRSKGILFNFLNNDEQAVDLFHQLSKDLLPDPHAYNAVRFKIGAHCRKKGNIRMAAAMVEAKTTYCGSPWKFFASVAAFIVILLTRIQTYFTINPVKN